MKAISCYSTEISINRTISQITDMLAEAKAQAILTEFENERPSAISFRIQTQYGLMTFRLPAQIDGLEKLLQKRDRSGRYLVPTNKRTREQAERTAWRIIRWWLEAQLAMIEAGLVNLQQIFLPYVQQANGRTLYENMKELRFDTYLLEQ